MEKIGIFGGSFNPVHNEHIKVAKDAIKELQLDKLFIIPTFVAPHKQGVEVLSGKEQLVISFTFGDAWSQAEITELHGVIGVN